MELSFSILAYLFCTLCLVIACCCSESGDAGKKIELANISLANKIA